MTPFPILVKNAPQTLELKRLKVVSVLFVFDSLKGTFDGNGTEGVEPVWGGYACQWIGNLNCTDEDFNFQCEGRVY